MRLTAVQWRMVRSFAKHGSDCTDFGIPITSWDASNWMLEAREFMQKVIGLKMIAHRPIMDTAALVLLADEAKELAEDRPEKGQRDPAPVEDPAIVALQQIANGTAAGDVHEETARNALKAMGREDLLD